MGYGKLPFDQSLGLQAASGFGGSTCPCLQELNELQAVSLPEHLVSSRLAQAVKARIPVTLCKYSHEVLMHHLQSCRLYLLLGIINDHIKLKVRCALEYLNTPAPRFL